MKKAFKVAKVKSDLAIDEDSYAGGVFESYLNLLALEAANVIKAWEKVPEHVWVNYKMLRVKGLWEQQNLKEAVDGFRKVWKDRPKFLRYSDGKKTRDDITIKNNGLPENQRVVC